MHQSAFDHMAQCVKEYVPTTGRLRIVDVGSRQVKNQARTHRELFDSYDCEYIGVDIVKGPNVDVVMTKPYRLPLRSNSADVVLSGQAFEHIPFFWVSMTEIARVMKPNGHAFITAPSRGHVHGAQDCWRFYPDGMRALAAWSGLELLEAFTDFPPTKSVDTRRHDYSADRSRHVLGRHRRRLPQTGGLPARADGGRCGRSRRGGPIVWAGSTIHGRDRHCRPSAASIRTTLSGRMHPARRPVTIGSVGCPNPRPPCSSTSTSRATRPPRSCTSGTTGTSSGTPWCLAEDRSLHIDAGLTVSFDTYFNSFYASVLGRVHQRLHGHVARAARRPRRGHRRPTVARRLGRRRSVASRSTVPRRRPSRSRCPTRWCRPGSTGRAVVRRPRRTRTARSTAGSGSRPIRPSDG